MATEILRPAIRGEDTGDECNIDAEVGAACPNHYQNVDEEPTDEATTCITTHNATYLRDLYRLAAHSLGSGTINHVTVYARCRSSSDNSQAALKIACKTVSVAHEGSEETLTSSFANYSKQWTTNPQAGGAWTWAQVDALQAGLAIREGQSDTKEITICTQVWVVVDYTPAGLVTRDEQVGASGDDVINTPSWCSTTNASNVMGDEAGENWAAALRFQTVDIPQGATILEAYLTLTASAADSASPVKVKIAAEDVDDAAAPDCSTRKPSTLWGSKTTADVDWDIYDAWVIDTEYKSPQIISIIQEIVDRASWAANNDMLILINDDGSGNSYMREWYAYDGSSAKASKLHIEYTAEEEGVSIIIVMHHLQSMREA